MTTVYNPVGPDVPDTDQAITRSDVSWGAVVAGAVGAVATTTILVVLGAGLGLSMVSPWREVGASATTVGVSAVIWLVIVQWISSGVGGFLAGRLRLKWVRVHTHEVFFRDTAHGFLAWSLATVVGTLLLASIAASGIGGAVKATASIGGAAASGAAQAGSQKGSGGNDAAYFVDSMFRSTNAGDGDKAPARAESSRIFAQSIQDGKVTLSPADKSYLTELISARAGTSQNDAEQRVDAAVTQMNDAAQKAREAADQARKRAAQLAVVTALSMLVGAFIASVAAAFGGGIRDEF